MATAILDEPALIDNFAELLERLGNVPPQRIRFHPAPGTATEADVVAARDSADKRLCELIDGVLVEKAMGTREAQVALLIGHFMLDFLDDNNLGIVLGADGMLRLWPGRIRIPDASFISWSKMPEGRLPDVPVAPLAPDLAVEVLSSSNTPEETQRKLEDLFRCGMRLAWVIDPVAETAEIYHSPSDCRGIDKNGVLDGEEVLPGFSLSLRKLFARTKQSRE